MKASKKNIAGERAKNPVSVLNGVDLQDNTQPIGGDNLPVGMREMPDDPLSANYGTDRASEVGRCVVGNDDAYVTLVDNVPALDLPYFRCSFTLRYKGLQSQLISNGYASNSGWWTNINVVTGKLRFASVTYSGTDTLDFDVSQYTEGDILYVTLEVYEGNKSITVNGVTVSNTVSAIRHTGGSVFQLGQVANYFSYSIQEDIWDAKYDELDSDGNFVKNWVHWKLDSLSGTTIYDSSGNKYHGTILNYYDGFWGEQNVKSFQNTDGFTISDGVSYYYDQAATQLIPEGELIPRLEVGDA